MHRTFSKFAIVGAAFVVLIGLTVLIAGKPAVAPGAGVVDDWTHHRLVYSNPGTAAEALAQGRIEQWYRIVNDPRYIMQQMKRNAMQGAIAPAPDFATLAARLGAPIADPGRIRRPPPPPIGEPTLKRDWSMDLGGSANVGAGMYPAKFSFSTTSASCAGTGSPDFVVYNTGVGGTTTQANVIAYDNLYVGATGSGGCGTSGVPTVYWSYYTGGGSAQTSTVLSWQGDKVAFIENPGSAPAVLRILKYVGGQGTDFSAPYNMTTSTYNYTNGYAGASSGQTPWTTCPSGSSCMISVPFQSPRANLDTVSSPWYDYNSDTLWVGDSAGYLHEFTQVFNGTPGEVSSGGGSCGGSCVWPVLVSSSHQLTGPVYDSSTGLVFVGDTATGAPLHSVCAVTGLNAVCTTVGTVTTSGTIAASGLGMSDAPIVDSTASKAYVFINTDTSSSCLTSGGSSTSCSAVFQYATKTSIASGSQTPVKAVMGRSMGAGIPLYAGAFNDGYYTGGASTGALYVCGGSPSNTSNQQPTLYKIAITTGTMASSSTRGPYVASTTGPFCSPVSEVLNGSSDYLFMSITAHSGDSCPGGCIYSYTIPSSFGTGLTANASLTAAGGTSGIIIDNTSSATGASQVYFGTLSSQACAGNAGTGSPGHGTGGCAVQAKQSNLQ